MRLSRLLTTIAVPALLCSVNCSDPGGQSSGGTSGAATGGVSSSGGNANAGSSSKAGTAGIGAGGTTAGSAGSAAGSGGSAAGSAGSAAGGAGGTGGGVGGTTGGAGGTGGGRIVTARDDFCTPRCALANGYCALTDVGCSGPGPCLLQAQCLPFEDCNPMAKPNQGCGPGGGVCVNDPLDDCGLGMAGCRFECICTETVTCDTGTSFDNDPAVCGCVPIVPPAKDCNTVDCPPDFLCKMVLGSPACVKPFVK